MEGIEFIVDIQDRLAGAVAASEALKKLYADAEKADHGVQGLEGAMKHAGAASHAAGNAHGEHGHKIWQLGHQYEYAKNGVHEFAEAIGLILVFEGVEKLVDGFIELGSEIVKAGAEAQRFELSVEALLGKEEGHELVEEIDSIGRYTEFANQRIEQLTANLLRVGFADEGLRRARAAAFDLAALPGGNLEEAAASLERIKRTGRVDNRTLGGIGFGENDFLTQLEARTGLGRAVLKKQMEDGKLDTEQALEALYDLIHRRTGKELGALGVEMSKTLEGRLTHLREAPEEIFKTVKNTDAFERLSEMIGSLAEDLAPDGAIGGAIVENLQGAFSTVVDFVDGIDWASSFQTGIDLMREMWDIAKKIADVFGTVAGYVNTFGDTLESLITVGHLTDRLGITSRGDREARERRDAFASPEAMRATEGAERMRRIRHAVEPVRDQLGVRSLSDFSEFGPMMAQGLYLGALAAAPIAEKGGAALAAAAHRGTAKEAEIRSPSRAFMRLGKLSAEGFAIGLDKGMDDAVDIPALSATVRPAFEGIEPKTGGGTSISAPVTVNMTINGGQASAQEIGDVVRVEVATAVLSALEQIALQGGQA